MATQMTAQEYTPRASEIARDIEATKRSLRRTVSRIETELVRARGTLRADALSAFKRVVIGAPVRKHPLIAVGVAAMVGMVAARALEGRRSSAPTLPLSHSGSRLKRGVALSVALLSALL